MSQTDRPSLPERSGYAVAQLSLNTYWQLFMALQLFDLVDDPGETRNLAGTSPRKVNELWAQAEAFHDSLTPFEMPPGGVSELFRMSREARQRARQRP
jgi:hypothetical protein